MSEVETEKTPTFISRGRIIEERGWSKAMVDRLLGSPDEYRDNPHYRSAAPMCMYSIARVDAAEKTAAFAEMLAKRQARGARAKQVADRKRAELVAFVEGLDIQIPKLDLAELASLAAANYVNSKYAAVAAGKIPERALDDLYEPHFAPWGEPDDFRDRVCRNYLRHCESDYERILRAMYGKIGIDEAYLALRERIDSLIDKQYPELGSTK